MGLLPEHLIDLRVFRLKYEENARNRDLGFTLTEDEFRTLVLSNCSYCGAEPQLYGSCRGNKLTIKLNGIDRINNAIGYNPGNCVTCCRTCNRAKFKMSAEDFLAWARKIVAYQGGN